VQGVVFFVAQTINEKNQAKSGHIVVAILAEDVVAFVRKYGTVNERTQGSSSRVDSKRLTGIFHQLDHGHVYIDESGNANDMIIERKENTKNAIR